MKLFTLNRKTVILTGVSLKPSRISCDARKFKKHQQQQEKKKRTERMTCTKMKWKCTNFLSVL